MGWSETVEAEHFEAAALTFACAMQLTETIPVAGHQKCSSSRPPRRCHCRLGVKSQSRLRPADMRPVDPDPARPPESQQGKPASGIQVSHGKRGEHALRLCHSRDVPHRSSALLAPLIPCLRKTKLSFE